jgi:hypothetical protein
MLSVEIMPMSQVIDMLEMWGSGAHVPPTDKLQVLRLDRNQTVIRLFTSKCVENAIHFCEELEPKRYVRCNGEGCPLCLAGKNVEKRMLLPVYVPSRGTIEVLAISPNSQPGALRPRILALLGKMKESSDPIFVLISKPDRTTFKVTLLQAGPHHDTGKLACEDFLKRWEAGQVDPAEAFQQLDNATLRALRGIDILLQFKEVNAEEPTKEVKAEEPGANDQRE